MVCPRCIKAVKSVLDNQHIKYTTISLGEAELEQETLTQAETFALKSELTSLGFELLEDKKAKLVDKVKALLVGKIYENKYTSLKLSELIADQIGQDYSLISNTFSAYEGITIEKYFILQKIERCKELLTYKELNLSEIASQLKYSSVAALSAQFKDVIGMTPTAFKVQNLSLRKPIDSLNS